MLFLRDQAGFGDTSFVTFRVYLSPQDKKTVFGYHQFSHQVSEDSFNFRHSDFGVPMAQAFNEAWRYAESKGISAIWIDDPNRLFDTTMSTELSK
jgi:hypothetical protein